MKEDLLKTIAITFAALSLIDQHVTETGQEILIPNDYELIQTNPPKKKGLVFVGIDCPTNFIAYNTLDENGKQIYSTKECNGTGYYSFYCIPDSLVFIGTKQPVNYIVINAELLYCSANSAVFLIKDDAAITAKKDFFEF